MPTKTRTTKARTSKREERQRRERGALIDKVRRAALTAYAEQERRTCDPVVKRAVADATDQMLCLILDQPWSPRPITLDDVDRVAASIRGSEHG